MTTATAICLDRYAGKEEAVYARRLVRKALEAGYSLSVNDGEEITVRRSTDRMTVLEAMATAGMDRIYFHNAEGKVLGSFLLVYQNGAGDELIADYTDNGPTEALYREVCPD
jgi:hypothetical protein